MLWVVLSALALKGRSEGQVLVAPVTRVHQKARGGHHRFNRSNPAVPIVIPPLLIRVADARWIAVLVLLKLRSSLLLPPFG